MTCHRIALAQFESVDDKAASLHGIVELMTQAAGGGAELIVFHEFATTSYFCLERNKAYFSLAEPIPGPSSDKVSEAATRLGIHVVLPLYELAQGRRYDTAALIEPGVGVVECYRKTHTTYTGAHGGEAGGNEPFYFDRGDSGFHVWETQFGTRVGVLICFDRHFPECQRVLGLRGADLVVCPTASSRAFIVGELWEAELQSMAFQNTYYVAGVNKVGPVTPLREGRVYPGRSVVVDFEGRIIARADDSTGVIMADIDPEVARQARAALRFTESRRPDLYAPIVEPLGEVDAMAFERREEPVEPSR